MVFPTPRAIALRSLLVLLTLAGGTLFVPGCGGDGPSNPADAGSASSAAPDGSNAPASLDRHGGEFRLSLSGVACLDPARSTSLSENLVLGQIFQGLVRFDPELLIVPDLAKTWSLSDDRRVYTFTLREDARFHNGRPVTAADVQYSFERILEPRTGSPARAYLEASLDGGIDAITTPSPDRVEIRLAERDHVFVSFLAMQHVKIVPREAVEAGDFAREPVGSGPFRFVAWEGDRIELEAFRSDENSVPFLDRLVFRDFDREEEKVALVANELDYLIVAPDELETIAELESFLKHRASTLSMHFLGMNATRPPFDDPRVREAMAFAIDRTGLEHATGGRVKAAKALLPPGLPGYDPDLDAYPFDPARATRLLAEAGFGGEEGVAFPEVELFLGRIPEQVELAEVIQADLRAVGIDARVRITDDYRRFVQELRETDLWVLGWGIDYPDPDNVFSNLFRSDAQYNFTGYANERVDAILREARHGEGARLHRAKLYREAEALVLADHAVVPLFHDAAVHCVAGPVRGIEVNALGLYYSRLDRVWISDGELTATTTKTRRESGF